MTKIPFDDENILVEDGVITELDAHESAWWTKEAIKPFRKKIVKGPKYYVEKSILKLGLPQSLSKDDVNNTIYKLRETAWSHYLQDEVEFHNQVIIHLVQTREASASILQELISKNLTINDNREFNFEEVLPSLMGNFIGRSMPYIYPLTLSTTNSRRSRSGATFELIISKMFEFLGVPFEDQKGLGNKFFLENHLSKKVDFIIPSKESFVRNRSKTMIVSTKTSLRERWQEVVEELNRTGNANIHLLTADTNISANMAQVMSGYNIILVVYDQFKETRLADESNVIGYSQFFSKEIPHIVSYNR